MPLSWGCLFCPSCHLLPHHPISSTVVLVPLSFHCLLPLLVFNPVCCFSMWQRAKQTVRHTRTVNYVSKQGTNLQWLVCCQVMIFNYSQPNAHRQANKLSACFYLSQDSPGGTLGHHTHLWHHTVSALKCPLCMFTHKQIKSEFSTPQYTQSHSHIEGGSSESSLWSTFFTLQPLFSLLLVQIFLFHLFSFPFSQF